MEPVAHITETDVHVITVGVQGPAGPSGPNGPPGGGALVDDAAVSASTVFSSQHVTELLGNVASAETTDTLKAKLGITTLSGSNTGDQVIPTALPASDVYPWAKAETKPSYTAEEVGAQPAGAGGGTGSAVSVIDGNGNVLTTALTTLDIRGYPPRMSIDGDDAGKVYMEFTGVAVSGPQGTSMGFRNLLRNGWFMFDSRNNGTAQVVTDVPTYCVDGWAVWGDAGAAGITVSRVPYGNSVFNKLGLQFHSTGEWVGSVYMAQVTDPQDTRTCGCPQLIATVKAALYGATLQLDGYFGMTAGEGVAGYASMTWTGMTPTIAPQPINDDETSTMLRTTVYGGSGFNYGENPAQYGVRLSMSFADNIPGAYVRINGIVMELADNATAFAPDAYAVEEARCRRFTRAVTTWVGTVDAPTSIIIDMAGVPTVTGGDVGFDTQFTTASALVCFQDVPGLQTLLLSCEPL